MADPDRDSPLSDAKPLLCRAPRTSATSLNATVDTGNRTAIHGGTAHLPSGTRPVNAPWRSSLRHWNSRLVEQHLPAWPRAIRSCRSHRFASRAQISRPGTSAYGAGPSKISDGPCPVIQGANSVAVAADVAKRGLAMIESSRTSRLATKSRCGVQLQCVHES